MYAYCANNPINNIDPTGKSLVIGAILFITGLIVGGATATQVAINKTQTNNAQKMLINGMTGIKPSSNTLNNLAAKAQNSPQVKKEVQKAITTNNGNNFSNYESTKVVFSSGDLGLSIGKVTNTIISGTKNQNNSWNITVTLQDRYNFEEWRKMNSFGNVANNLGFIAEKTGSLTPYDWDISFSFTYNEE